MAELFFAVPDGWRLEHAEEIVTLVGPEGDLRIAFVELEAGGSVQDTALAAWQKIDPGFGLPVAREVTVPPQGGWDEVHQIIYRVPSKESRMELAVIRKLGGRAFVNLVRGSMAGIGRRGAQLNEAIGSWKPEGYREVSLQDAAASAWTEEQSARLREFIVPAMAAMEIPGLSIAVVQGGEVVWATGLGIRGLGGSEPVTPRTRFLIGSTTKPLTTLLMARLIEQGKAKWSTPVVELLPDFALADPEMTRRLELSHTASASTGMPRQDMEFVFRYSAVTAEDRIAQLKAMRPTTGFGETFQYSNFLVAAGGYAAARAFTKEGSLESAFEAAMTEMVFRPLQMNDSCLRQEDARNGEMAMPHATAFEGGTAAIPLGIERSVQSVAPAGGAWSTALDLARYVLLELGRGKMPGGERVTSEETLLERRKRGVKIDEKSSYGLGLFVSDVEGLTVIHHAGNTFGYSADMFFLPDRDLGVVMLTNVFQANAFLAAVRQKIFELAFGAEPKAEKTIEAARKIRREGLAMLRERTTRDPAPMEWVAALVGRYACAELGGGELSRRDTGYWMQFAEWGSEVGSEIEPSGDRLLRLLSPPWSGGLKLLVDQEKETLTLDHGQSKYVFQKQDANLLDVG